MTLLRVTGEVTLGSDVELRFTQAGKAVASFSAVASKSKKNEAGEWVDDKQAWVRVTVWDKMAEHVAGSFSKGSRVVIIGDLHVEDYEKDGVKRQSINVTAHEVGASVRFGDTTFRKADRSATATPGTATAAADNPWEASPNDAPLPF